MVRFIVPSQYIFDARGDRLQQYSIRRVANRDLRRIYLRGPDPVARQIELVLQGQSCTRLDLEAQHKRDWTHRLQIRGPVGQNTRDLLALLGEIITVQAPDEVDLVLALDFYKDPHSDPDPMKWANTEAGDLISRGKYRGMADAEQELAQRIVEVIRQHPLYDGADALASVPGHNRDHRSFGERLAQRVANGSGKRMIAIGSRRLIRPEAKELDHEGRQALLDEFEAPEEVRGRVVVVVDDVYRSGTTMQALARAIKQRGGRAVLGIVGARTMRRR